METSELYSLSSSVADDSSDKSDCSVGRHFDFGKFPDEDSADNPSESKKENFGDKAKTLLGAISYEYSEAEAKLPAQLEAKKLKDDLVLGLSRSNAPQQQTREQFLQQHHQQQFLQNFPANSSDFEDVAKSGTMLDQRAVLHASNVAAFERLRGSGILAENTGILERSDLRNFRIQSSSRVSGHFDPLTFERMRHSQFLGKEGQTLEGQKSGWASALPREVIASQMQQTHSQQHQQQQQQGHHQQAKSFTIDAILGLRNNQREKHRNQQCRKHQGRVERLDLFTVSYLCDAVVI